MRGLYYPAIVLMVVSARIHAKLFELVSIDAKRLFHEKNDTKRECAIDLNFTNVGLQKIGPKFIVNPLVKQLIMQKNQIRELAYGAFDGLPGLTLLDLSYNNLTPDNLFSFGSHSNLKIIIMDNNYLGPERSLGPLSISNKFEKLKYLSLRNIYMDTFPLNLASYLSGLTHLDVSENIINTTNVFTALPSTVTHLYLEKIGIARFSVADNDLLKNILFLSLNGNKFDAIASINTYLCEQYGYLCLNLPNLQSLSVADCGVKEIKTNAFKYLGSLANLNLSCNYITELPEIVFQQTARLNVLDLSNNPLTKIPNFNLLRNLTKLVINDMENTAIVSELLRIRWSLNKLLSLSLSGNKLETVPLEMIEYLPSLQELNLSRNLIKSLQFNWATTLKHLQRFYLNDNAITSIDKLYLNGTTSLEYLNVENNPIAGFSAKSFKLLSNNLNILYQTLPHKYGNLN